MSTLRRIRSPLGAPRGRAGFVDPARRTPTLVALALPGLALWGLLVAGCSSEPDPSAVPTSSTRVLTSEELARSGGAATVFNDGAGAFEQPVPGLSSRDRRRRHHRHYLLCRRAVVHHRTRRAGPALQRPVLFLVPLPRRPGSAPGHAR